MENKIKELELELKNLKEINSELEMQLLNQGKISASTISHLFEAFSANNHEKITNYGLFIAETFQKMKDLRLSAKIINNAVTGMTDPAKIIKPCSFEEPKAFKLFEESLLNSRIINKNEPFEMYFEFFGGEKMFGIYEYDVFKNAIDVVQDDFDHAENINMGIKQGSKHLFFNINRFQTPK